MPVRVSDVPKMHSQNVALTSTMFQTFIMPFFLLHHYRMQKRRRGDPRQQRGVFHRVPAPVAAPAQHRIRPTAPSSTPVVWNIQVTSVQRRVVWIHASPGCLVISDAIAKANGTTNPT